MSDVLAEFGLGSDDLAAQIEDVEYPKPVKGRVAHIDADFLAYEVSAESRDELDGIKPRKSLEDMQHNARMAAQHLMRSAAADSYVCHITPTASTKGGRPAQAVQQQYQGNRKDRDRPEFLDTIRAYIVREMNGIAHLYQEADDGMAQANYNAQGPNGEWRDGNKHVIVSRDKDLRMVPGLHYDFDTGEVVCTGDRFGSIWLDEKLDEAGKVKSRNLKGWGTKFFWAQCLMGDPADHIKGLPAMSGMQWLEVQPTKAYKKLVERWHGDETNEGLLHKIRAEQARTKQVGPVLTYEYLKDCRNDRDCFQAVKAAWVSLQDYSGYEFMHWSKGKQVTATQALLGDMRLLWMRRNDNPDDVIDWIKEIAK